MKNYFTQKEFTRRGFPVKPTADQSFLLNNLRDKILNPIRHQLSRPVILTDCFRTLAKYYRLLKKYNPSATSDHFFGQAIPTIRRKDKKRFGKYFKYSVGAVDFRVPGANMREVFQVVKELEVNCLIKIGQAILEFNPKRRSSWIHISNPLSLVYSDSFIYDLSLQKERFLISEDNGKTYKIF